MRYQELENEIQKCKPYLQEKWAVQNDKQDQDTNFVYYCKTLESCKLLAKENEIDEIYAIHRWYNYVCSKAVEEIFCELGAEPCENPKNKLYDLKIDGTCFDIKVSKFVLKAKQDLYTRQGKNEMIRWLTENQSKEGRSHLGNKLYVVCVAETDIDAMMLKSNFKRIKQACERFLEYYKDKPFNTILVKTDQNAFSPIYADLIYVKKEQK